MVAILDLNMFWYKKNNIKINMIETWKYTFVQIYLNMFLYIITYIWLFFRSQLKLKTEIKELIYKKSVQKFFFFVHLQIYYNPSFTVVICNEFGRRTLTLSMVPWTIYIFLQIIIQNIGIIFYFFFFYLIYN